jgi:uncharacterized protein YecE (DUF72 family)
VLSQLPPNRRVQVRRFEAFLETLTSRRRHVIEFREPSWYRRRRLRAFGRLTPAGHAPVRPRDKLAAAIGRNRRL